MTILSKLVSVFVAVSLVQCSFNMNTNQVSGEGPVITKNFEIENPEKIKVSNGWDVQLIPNQSPQVVVKANENLMEILEINESEGTLSLGAQDNIGNADSKLVKIYYDSQLKLIKASSGTNLMAKEKLILGTSTIDASSGADMELSIKADVLKVEGSSGSDIELKADSQELTLNASSSSDITINGDNKRLKAKATSGSDVELEGISEDLELEATSGSDIHARDLQAKRIKAKASSGASVDCYPVDALEATASSGADIRYYNDPAKNVTSRSSSGGSVKRD